MSHQRRGVQDFTTQFSRCEIVHGGGFQLRYVGHEREDRSEHATKRQANGDQTTPNNLPAAISVRE
jgi:hypothetical protein